MRTFFLTYPNGQAVLDLDHTERGLRPAHFVKFYPVFEHAVAAAERLGNCYVMEALPVLKVSTEVIHRRCIEPIFNDKETHEPGHHSPAPAQDA